MEKKNAVRYDIVASILFVIIEYYSCCEVFIVGAIENLDTVLFDCKLIGQLFFTIGCSVLSVSVLTKKDDALSCIGFGIFVFSKITEAVVCAVFDLQVFNHKNILEFLGYLSAAIISCPLCARKRQADKFRFVPAVFIAAEAVASSVIMFLNSSVIRGGFALFIGAVKTCAILIACMLPAFGNGISERFENDDYSVGFAQNARDGLSKEAYCSIIKHVLLLQFAYPVWIYVWIYRVTECLNTVQDENVRNPVTKTLLCMFVPFYICYWAYKTAKCADRLTYQDNSSSKFPLLCTFLAFSWGPGMAAVLQDKINCAALGKLPFASIRNVYSEYMRGRSF